MSPLISFTSFLYQLNVLIVVYSFLRLKIINQGKNLVYGDGTNQVFIEVTSISHLLSHQESTTLDIFFMD